MQIRARRNSYGKKVVKVVFTGGPSAGKSSRIAHAKERIHQKYGDQWKCYTVADAATVLNSTSRVSSAELIEPCLKHWQRDMLECMRMFEKVYDDLAAIEPTRHTIIFCDGATLDAKVSTPHPMWPQILQEMATTERQLIASYDLVLEMHTAPDVKSTAKASKRLRREAPDETREIDMRYAEVWQEHPHVVDIKAHSGHAREDNFEAVWLQIETLLKRE